ncbi:hypothetical protein EON82_22190 [bacterium]|nr:MAG: hypothetical protein EON82_22190 [bacterium]
MKILIRSGVRYDEFSEVIKGVYVESAIRDGLGTSGTLTRSRVSLVTGITRADVDRFVDDEGLLRAPPPTHASTLTEVLHLWNTEPRYLGPFGVPLEIDFDDTPGRSFADLVRRVDPSVEPRMILEDLQRSGVVVASGERFFKVISRTYVMPEVMSPVMLEHLGNTLTNLAETLEFNMRDPEAPKRLERSVFADNGLEMTTLPQFEKFARGRVQQLITDLDDWLARYGRVLNDDEPRATTGISIFHYVKPLADQESLAELVGGEAQNLHL